MKPKIPVIIRLQTHHTKDEHGCWNWSKHRGFWGYGVINVDNKTELAHRVSYRYLIGDFPPELCVLHKCDNPACINPDHLFLGTNSDNVKDKVSKGRQSSIDGFKGEDHPCVKLTEDQVRHIRNKEMSQSKYAQLYNVTQSMISNIQLRKAWKHI